MKKSILIILIIIAAIICVYLFVSHEKPKKKSDIITYHNVYVIDTDSDMIYGFYDNKYLELKTKGLNSHYEGIIADITIEKEYVKELKVKSDYINGRLLNLSEEKASIENYDLLSLEKEVRVYSVAGELKAETIKDVYIGYDCYKYYVADGKIAAIVKISEIIPDTIRVLIKTDDYKEIFHDSISLTSDCAYCVSKGEQVTECNPGITYNVTADEIIPGESIKIKSLGQNGIRLLNNKRLGGDMTYKGQLEISRFDEGIVLINELPLEEYLRNVVPSEMPSGYEKEALKAQSVCARTYAYSCIKKGCIKEYGAHLDDSISYQVYNNISATDNTDAAVSETFGQILKCGDELADIYYYSTSCGLGADETVWGSKELEYDSLFNHTINDKDESIDMSSEDTFIELISSQNENDYDYKYPYYRWNGTVSYEELSKSAQVGAVRQVNVTKRLKSGCVSELTIVGDNGKRVIKGQYEIRKILGKDICKLKDNNNNEAVTAILPSAFFYLKAGAEGEAVIVGGGLGHGAGMSQNAACTMAKNKKKYDEILYFFFKNTKIEFLY